MSTHDTVHLPLPLGIAASIDALARLNRTTASGQIMASHTYLAALTDVRTCVGCGCTDDRACAGGCAWASYDPPVCSSCRRGGFIDTLGSLL